MHPEDAPVEHGDSAIAGAVNNMASLTEAAGWDFLIEAVREAKFTVEQETLS